MGIDSQVTFEPFVNGLDHPECVAPGSDGRLYAGGEAGQVYRVSLDGSFEQIGSTGGFALGICLDGDDNVYVCDMARNEVVRVAPDGTASVYAAGLPDRPLVNPNYPVFDDLGNLYVSASGGWKTNDGCIWVVRPGGASEVLRDDVTAFPNGLAINPAGDHLYAIESLGMRVVRVAISEGRSSGPVEKVLDIPERHLGDGLAFDAEGGLYVACYTPDVIYRLSPDGVLEKVAEDWESVALSSPTNLAFVGTDRRTLVSASLARWHLSRAEVRVPGMPLRYPRIPRGDLA